MPFFKLLNSIIKLVGLILHDAECFFHKKFLKNLFFFLLDEKLKTFLTKHYSR